MIIIMLCVIVAVAATLTAAYFVTENSKKQQADREQQYIEEVLLYIDIKYSSFTVENDRLRRAYIYNELLDYQAELENQGFENDSIDAKFNFTFERMIYHFVAAYNVMINNVEAEAVGIFTVLHYNIDELLAEIDSLTKEFETIEIPSGAIIYTAENNTYRGRTEKVLLFNAMLNKEAWFVHDTFIDDFFGELQLLIVRLIDIREIINSDGVVTDTGKLQPLFDSIERLSENYTEELKSEPSEAIIHGFDSALDDMRTWFFDNYTSVFDEISERDSNSISAIEKQLSDLEDLKEVITEEAVLNPEMLLQIREKVILLYETLVEKLEALKEAAAQIPPPPPPGQNPGQTQTPGQNPGQTPGQTPPPAPPAQPPADVNPGALASEVLRLTNIERENYGLPALSGGHSILDQAAAIRAEEIVILFSHTRPDGRGPFSTYIDLGGSYSSLGENIAVGYRSAASVVQGWMDSPGHMRNILDPDYTHLSVAVTTNADGRVFWVQMFMG